MGPQRLGCLAAAVAAQRTAELQSTSEAARGWVAGPPLDPGPPARLSLGFHRHHSAAPAC
jgi:hypothetical protein